MKKKQLIEAGIPEDCVNTAIQIVANGNLTKEVKKNAAKREIPKIVENPEAYQEDPIWSSLAKAIIQNRKLESVDLSREPAKFKIWGENIEESALQQMRQACKIPSAFAGVVLPDAQTGYGLNCGGVIGLINHVSPYAIGPDISCMMHLSVLDIDPKTFDSKPVLYDQALTKGSLFGNGQVWKNPKNHQVMDDDWAITPITRGLKDIAWKQLGTSGSGNHFVDAGILTLNEPDLGLTSGEYVALLSHSGSRKSGYDICDYYHSIAYKRLPKRYQDEFRYLAWLDLETNEGQEYWLAMQLMGKYAAANHELIHRDMARLLGAKTILSVVNPHNFAWRETHFEQELIVHRKGATPAAEGQLGIIPGSMGDPGFLVRGKGNKDSLMSASHGAGRRMSRREARQKFNKQVWDKELKRRNIRVLDCGTDELPGAYKSIYEVMDHQRDLVDIIARFDPRVVIMAGEERRRDRNA